jgi:LmbE family N-acetylglucosaminyl deacetylase
MEPVASEKNWQHYLSNLLAWQPIDLPTFIITPHPDDETLGAGGLIADLIKKGVDVTVVSVTNGENAYVNFPQLSAIRKVEQENALYELGLTANKIIRLNITDSDVQANVEQLENALLKLIRTPANIFATWLGDFHPDHEAVGQAALKVAQQTASKLTFYFFWTWHRGTIATIQQLPLRIYPLNMSAYNKKQAAIHCYQSQLAPVNEKPILPKKILIPAQRDYEVFYPYEF